MRFYVFTRVLVSLVGVVATGCFALPAHAQIIATLTQSLLSGDPGETVTYAATIENQSAQDYFFNALTFQFASGSGDPQDVIDTVDGNSFLDYFATTYPDFRLPAGETYTGNLVNVSVRADAPEGASDEGLLTLKGGLASNSLNDLDQLLFGLSRTVIPEAPSSLLMASGAVALCGMGYVRRRKRVQVVARR